jgi:DNA-binding transcriptional ArsR family regulator
MATTVDVVLSALGDETRRLVVERLSERPMRAGELAQAAGVSRPAMSRHLRLLLRAGIVSDERRPEDARLRVFSLRPDSISALQAWLGQVQASWDAQLRSFKRHVERTVADG